MVPFTFDNIHSVAGQRDSFNTVAHSVPISTTTQLPTPPNSISLTLQPQGLKAQLAQLKHNQRSSLNPEHLVAHDNSISGALDSIGTVTPALLARNHLPTILLRHGPLAIRHIMGYLMTEVPGFSAIPPTKARRLVVGALETQFSNGSDNDIIFEKVGWGRWGARHRGQPSLAERLSPVSSDEGDMEIDQARGIPIARGTHQRKEKKPESAGDDSIIFSHNDTDDYDMMEMEADRMSLDGSGSASCSEAPEDDDAMVEDEDDVTDDEDWGAMGAAALRAESYSTSVTNKVGFIHSPTFGSSSMRVPASFERSITRRPQVSRVDYRVLATTSNPQEREAVEALLRLGSL